MGDVRLWIAQKRTYTYPDVMILAHLPEYFNNRLDIQQFSRICTTSIVGAQQCCAHRAWYIYLKMAVIVNPQVIVEVLSTSIKSYDHHDKFEDYRTIPTFKEYLLIAQNRIYVEQFSKTGKKQWALREYHEEDEAMSDDKPLRVYALVTVPFQISLSDLYNKVQFELVETQAESADVEG